MKFNKIFISGLAMLSLTACNDYLDVEPATNVANTEFVYSTEGEISTALNGVYAKILSDETFGRKLYLEFLLNSDVDFTSNANESAAGNQPRRFDVRPEDGNVEKLWNNLYSGIETANEFIYNLKNSSLYKEGTTTESTQTPSGVITEEIPDVTNLTQMMGEAKVIRAMFYHELLSYWGDIPFSFKATYETENLLPEITNRQAVSDSLIADLRHAAEYMKSDANTGIERISKEAAYAMIARLALQAGGYSLNHDAGDATNYKMTRPSDYKKYYEIARDYTKRIIDGGGHKLTKSYAQVFVDECNFLTDGGDDVIFEIPFARGASSCWGYYQGPASSVDASVETDFANSLWGETKGNSQLSYFYRFQFDENDQRRDFICGMWGYGAQGQPTIRLMSSSIYTIYNNKWSKLWTTGGYGKTTTSSTGINFAYIRYADVLLMFAEADNELNGPRQEAIDAVNQVRNRAFQGAEGYQLTAEKTASKEAFLRAILDERKLEFAGENMRWKDLVRNNLYSEVLMYTYYTYLAVAEDMGGSTSYMDMVEEYAGKEYSQMYNANYYYTYVKNYNGSMVNNLCHAYFPNNSLYMLYILNPYSTVDKPSGNPNDYFKEKGIDVESVSLNSITGLSGDAKNPAWVDSGDNNNPDWSSDGTPRNQIFFSLYGYIRGDIASGNTKIVDNGAVKDFHVNIDNPQSSVNSLPAVRYMLPIPAEAIARSNGAYKNYYGF